MKTFLTFAGIENGDSSPSIILTCDSGKYMFNCGEAAYRSSLEFHQRTGKLSTIFSTSAKWDALGGIPSLLLSLANAGNKHIRFVLK
jgi:ribonuclease Z